MREVLERPRREAIQARARVAEEVDPIPLEVPVGHSLPPTMRELVQEYVQGALSEAALSAELGSFEEEDDFEVPDENLLDLSGFEVSLYEMVEEDPNGVPAGPEATPLEGSEQPPDPSLAVPATTEPTTVNPAE